MSVGQNPPFFAAGIVAISASTTSSGAALPPGGDTVVITNPTAALAWIALGGGATPPTAVAGACIPVLRGSRRIMSAQGATQVAAVLASGTGSLYAEVGTGSAI
jgi:hypothetical protein